MTNPTINDAQTASIQNPSNEFADDNYLLKLLTSLSPIFRGLLFSAMSVRFGNLKPANDAVYSFTRKKESSRQCRNNADKTDGLAKHLKNPQT